MSIFCLYYNKTLVCKSLVRQDLETIVGILTEGLYKQENFEITKEPTTDADLDPTDYVSLGDVCRNRLGMQCQYGSRYANDICKDLRITGTTADYHSMTIHKDDVDHYVGRALKYRYQQGIISESEFTHYAAMVKSGTYLVPEKL